MTMGSTIPDGLPAVCRLLRTKAYYQEGRQAADMQRSGGTAIYYCIASMLPFGPDGGYACPEECIEGRACYREDQPGSGTP